jgi:hypothetical protein
MRMSSGSVCNERSDAAREGLKVKAKAKNLMWIHYLMRIIRCKEARRSDTRGLKYRQEGYNRTLCLMDERRDRKRRKKANRAYDKEAEP